MKRNACKKKRQKQMRRKEASITLAFRSVTTSTNKSFRDCIVKLILHCSLKKITHKPHTPHTQHTTTQHAHDTNTTRTQHDTNHTQKHTKTNTNTNKDTNTHTTHKDTHKDTQRHTQRHTHTDHTQHTTKHTQHTTKHTTLKSHLGSSFTVRRQKNSRIEAKAQFHIFAITKPSAVLIHGRPREMVLPILQLVQCRKQQALSGTAAEAGQVEEMQGTQGSGRASIATPCT